MKERALLAILLCATFNVAYAGPEPQGTTAIVAAIDGARNQVLVSADQLTNREIIEALGRANGRAVKVELLIDESKANAEAYGVSYLRNRGVPVWVGTVYRNQNALVLDRARLLLVGCEFASATCSSSYGATTQKEIVKRYLGRWQMAMTRARHFLDLAFLVPPTVLASCQ